MEDFPTWGGLIASTTNTVVISDLRHGEMLAATLTSKT